MPTALCIKLSAPATRQFWEIPILFEDPWLLALDKPAGLLSSPDRYQPLRPNLMGLLHEGIRRGVPWAQSRELNYLANAHRLDFETSGLILLAKSKAVLIQLAEQFGAQKPVKHYLGLTHGNPAAAFAVEAKLAPHPRRPELVRVDAKHGKFARTSFRVLEFFAGYALVEAQPFTGRTHQIRVHLRHAGFPLIGDSLYGGHPLFLSRLKQHYRLKPGRTERPLLARVALHAERLTLTHPVSGTSLTVTAPWPKDLRVAITYLRRYAEPSQTAPTAPSPSPGQ